MFKKKLIALGLTLAMIGSMVACGKTETKPSGGEAQVTPAGENGAGVGQTPNSELASAIDDHSSVDKGSIIDFEDGKFTFLTKNDTDWARDKDTEISVADKFSSKVLYLTRPNGAVPAFAIDVNGLLGDKSGDCVAISVDIGVDPKDGKFAACGGFISAFVGESSTKIEQRFNLITASKSFKTVKIELGDQRFVQGAKNYFAITGVEDTASTPSNLFIDNIIFLDKDGKAIPVNTACEFAVKGVGEYDWSNACKQPTDEKLLFTGVKTGTGWWPDNGNSISFTNPETTDLHYVDLTKVPFGKGDVLTIYYEVADPDKLADFANNAWAFFPFVRIQNWKEDGVDDDKSGWYGGIIDCGYHTGSNEGKDDIFIKAEKLRGEDGIIDGDVAINKSYTIVQYSYEYIEAAAKACGAGDDFIKYADFFGIADMGTALNINAVTIGKAAQ